MMSWEFEEWSVIVCELVFAKKKRGEKQTTHPIRPLVQKRAFLVIAAKKKDYHWRIFFSFPFAEERKRQNPKTKKYRVHVR